MDADTQADALRYQFLRESYALHDEECESAFRKLAFMSGKEFDDFVDAEMAKEKHHANPV